MMPRRVLAVTLKIFSTFRHDRRSVAMVLLAPILAMFIFGLAFSGEVENVEIVIVNKDEGAFVPGPNATVRVSVMVIDNLDDDKVDIRYMTDVERALEEVRSGDANSVVIFPENFTRDLFTYISDPVSGANATVIIMRSDQTQVTISSEVQMAFRDALTKTVEQNGLSFPIGIDSSEPVYGKGARFIDMFVPGIMGFTVFLLTTIVSLITFVGERTKGTLQRLLGSSVTEGEIVTGYAIAFGTIGLVQVGILLSLAVLVFHIIVEGNFLIAFLIASLLAVVSVSMGIFLSSFASRESQAIQFFPLIILPSFLLSGVFWPREAMPYWLRPFSYLIPVTYAVEGLRSVLLRGWGILDIWVDVLMLCVFAAVFLAGAVISLRVFGRR